MKPFLKFGLIVGFISLLVIIPVAAVMGICGPAVTLIAGAIAGFLSAYNGGAMTSKDGAQSGAIAGALAGGITLIGQLIGGIAVLVFFQVSRTPNVLGRVPEISDPIAQQIIYYASGMGTGVCFGIIGICLGAVVGGVAGALGVRSLPPTPPAPPVISNTPSL